MNIRDLDHKNICILGFGREGRATYESLRKYAPAATITIADADPGTEVPAGAELISGPAYLERLDEFDAIIKSPGINWRPEGSLARKLTSATELFMGSLPSGVTVIGVTGTKGKSTTSHLICEALRAGGLNTFLAGNIGEPMLAKLPEAKAGAYFVLELSSYQLETLRTSPHIAVVTSFFPDHLDYHGSLEAYLEAKEHIARYQTAADVVFFNAEYPECKRIADSGQGRKVPFTAADAPAAAGHSANRANLAAAVMVAAKCGVPEAVAAAALAHAPGLPHRQQALGLVAGIQWIDDSAATTPESTISAVTELAGRIDTIIVGGLDRGYDFGELGRRLAQSEIRNFVLFPDTGQHIHDAIEKAGPHPAKHYFETSSMAEAAAFAAAHTRPGLACLLSSGSPSYNMFKNYGERGLAFADAVHRLPKG